MTLRLRKRSLFPALVVANSPLLLDKEGSTYTFSLDGNALVGSLPVILQGLAAIDSTAGLLTQTGATTFTKRTLTGTANEITVTNGDGVAGAPTLSLPTALTFTGKTVTGGSFLSGTWNRITFTAPATGATLTISDGKTVALTNSLTISGADGKTLNFGNSFTLLTTDNSTLTFQGTDTYVGRGTADTFTGVKTFNNGKFVLAGSTSGTTIVNASATASGTLTLPAATDTLVGKATTDTLTNKTFDSAGTGNSFSISGVAVSRGQFPGTNTNDNATAGNIGEYVSANVASGAPVSLTTSVVTNVTSISLGAGDWDVQGKVGFTGGATTTVTRQIAGISSTSATLDTSNDRLTRSVLSGTPFATDDIHLTTPVSRFSLSATTTIFLVVYSAFGTSTSSAYGIIRARRVR